MVKWVPWAAGDQRLCSFSIYNCKNICKVLAEDKDGCNNHKLPFGKRCKYGRNSKDRCIVDQGSIASVLLKIRNSETDEDQCVDY
jgi:hypothetical protein